MSVSSTKKAKLTARDFVYVNDEVIGRSYQNGPYAILVGSRSYYAVTYQGQTIAYNLRCFPAAVEACTKHDTARRIKAGDRVTIVNRFGQQHTGRAVMKGPHGWVLNMGGRYGTPAIANESNIIKVRAATKTHNPKV